MLFQNWSGIGRVLLVGSLAYVLLVAVLRTSGKRTLAKLNAFDLVVTVALGSTLATILLTSDVALAEGGAGLVLLVVLQYVVARLSVRSRTIRRAVRSEPTLVLRDGRLVEPAMQRCRVTPAEVQQAVRSQGIASLEDVGAVVLEPDGSLSVVQWSGRATCSALADVRGWERRPGACCGDGP